MEQEEDAGMSQNSSKIISPTPISMIEMTSLFPFKIFHGWAESSEVIFGDTESTVSPRLLTFWLKAPVLSTNIYLSSINFWSDEQLNLIW